ncbi:membrane protein [Spirochaetia bacterium]|nr:membrane protein [Spirochaetia bacterium]
MKRDIRNNIFLVIRITLIASIIINFVLIFGFLSDPEENKSEVFSLYSKNFEFIFCALVTFALSFGTAVIEAYQKTDIPDILEIVIVLFIYAGIFLSSQFNLYYTYFWWDDLLHTLSGIIIGFIGFIVIYKINHKYSMNISPLLVAFFSFAFAVTLGVIWEILEFSCDALMGSAHQKWDLPDTEILMGKPYQGSGLRDTMSDLIVDSIGAFITSLITYYMYKNQKKETLEKIK